MPHNQNEAPSFEHLLNAFEQASQSEDPAANGYADKRASLLQYVRHLEGMAGLKGTWPPGSHRAFVEGATWWEFQKSGGTMRPSDQDKVVEAAERKYGPMKEGVASAEIPGRPRIGRDLQPGDQATTDYNGIGTSTLVQIVERLDRREVGHSQSGIVFRVEPPLRNGTPGSWYDADWFRPVS